MLGEVVKKEYVADNRICVKVQGLRFVHLDQSMKVKNFQSNWWLKFGYKGHQQAVYYAQDGKSAKAMYAKLRKVLDA